MLKRQGVSGKRLRSWIGLRTDAINRFLNQTPNRWLQKENWVDMAIVVMEESEGFENVEDTKAEVELDAWRRLEP